ncbi:hypothetical protein B7Y94_02195 [Candidatus Saccharibacteria bacterium 32-49-12]|nr:MAG: hypothetical protein B7Y94_02195 [Candidatus Saccharibacteria bacterium 32-49-12]
MNDYDVRPALENMFNQVIEFLPQLLAAIAILVIGYLISAGIARLIRRGLKKVRFDRALHSSPAGGVISHLVESPTQFAGKLSFWLIFFAFISMAVAVLDIELLNELLAAVYAYVPNIIAAIVIFLIASAVATAVPRMVQRAMGRTAMAKTVSTAVPIIIMSLAGFMILNQLGVARDIVNILFTAIVGATALGMALAFGLGGRDAAKRALDQAVDSARANSGKLSPDIRTPKRSKTDL